MPTIDLNCDLGESFGAYTIGMDDEILPYVTSANIACGFHAGDPSVMKKSVLLCKKYGVQVGAHPGLPDLQGFGRRKMAISPAEAEADVVYQIGALKAFCDAAGVPLHHVKPHGALYNMAAKDPALAAAICRAVQAAAPGAVLLALSGSEMIKAAHAIGLPVASEVFADRGYQPDGTLVPRGTPGAMVEDEDTAIVRVLQMAKQGTVQANDGSTVTLQADSVCIHGDGPKALAFVQKISTALPAAGVEVRAFTATTSGATYPTTNCGITSGEDGRIFAITCRWSLPSRAYKKIKAEAVAQGQNPSAAASLRLNASRRTKTLAIDPLIPQKQITQTGPSE